MNSKRLVAIVVACGLAGGVLFAQTRGGGSEWPTAGGDAQRTSWIRTDAAISIQSLSKPGFDLQWKSTLDNQPRGSNGLSQGVTANGVTLFVPMSLVTGSSNNVYAIDNDTGYVVWQRHFDAPLPAPTAACPGGITAAPTRIAAIAPPAPPAGRGAGGGGGGGGRGAGYRGAVSEPGQGVPAELASRNGGGGAGRGAAPGAATPPGGRAGAAGGGANTGGAAAGTTPPDPARGGGAPPDPARGGGAPPDPARGGGAAPDPARGAGPGGPGGRGGAGGGGNAGGGIPGAAGAGGGGGFGRSAGVVYVVSSDGVLHVLGLQAGKDLQKPALFLPPNAKWSDAIAVNEMMYAATSQNCGGAPNGIWAIDLAGENKPVTSWTTNGGGIVGALSFTTDGTLIAAIGPGTVTPGGYSNAIVAFDAKTLHVKDWFTSPSAEFTSAPIIFKQGDKDIVAVATRDGRVLLFDAASLGGADHATPLYASQPFTSAPGTSAPDALATWQEMLPAPTAAPAAPAAAGAGGAGGAAAAPPPPAMLPGTRWLLLPVAGTLPTGGTWPLAGGAITNGAIVALKLVDQGGKLSLQPGWVSRDLTSPSTPIIVNGVVFAVSKGKPAPPPAPGATGRATPAVLYAMDGASGKDMWNSGTTMTSHATGRSFWSATGQVYVGTLDGALYAFGFAMERK